MIRSKALLLLSRRLISSFLSFGIFFLQCVPPAAAAQFSVFSKTYVRDADTPDVAEDDFSVLNPDTDWTLRAINGSLSDDSVEKVSSSTLHLNSEEVLQANQFNQNVNLIESPSALLTNNRIATQLKSKPGEDFAPYVP